MSRTWTFGRKIAAGFVALVALVLLISGISMYSLATVVASKDRVIDTHARRLVNAEKLQGTLTRKSSAGRGYLLTGDASFLTQVKEARSEFTSLLAELRREASAEDVQVIDRAARVEAEHQQIFQTAFSLRRTQVTAVAVATTFDDDVAPKRDELRQVISAFIDRQKNLLETSKLAATSTATTAMTSVLLVALLVVIVAIVVAVVLTRGLSRQIGSAVQHVQSSSSELQSAANQQATGSKEQASAMNEITTTIRELLATSRQIAESAQRVAHIAAETAAGAKKGALTVRKSNDAITGISRHVDQLVTHMLDLGKKSQQIGGILEIINELSEQTNILAINATIEAAGAGEHGRRFAVVADEIRKLADRVGGSTKEIRGLIEEIRAAVNTTVMATESGTKAVDAGVLQFADVTASFEHITGLVVTTTEAAREIELSTKQQATAIEQVNLAVANVAQASRETEASSTQTLQTASELSGLSRNLMRLIRPDPSV